MSNRFLRKSYLMMATGICLSAMVLTMTESAPVQAQSSDSSAAAATEVRFQQLEKEIRRLTNQIEEQNHQISQLHEELKRVTGDMDVRITDMEAKGGSGNSTALNTPAPAPYNKVSPDVSSDVSVQNTEQGDVSLNPHQPSGGDNSFNYVAPNGEEPQGQLGTLSQSPTTGEISGGGGEAVEYEAAYAYIKNSDFENAQQAFESFIAKYPSSSYIPNAKYWYGEAFYVRGNYEKAARVFAESYQADPKGSKAASNLLKLGMSLAGLNKKKDACVAFKQLKNDYASSAVPVLKRADAEMKKIGCK